METISLAGNIVKHGTAAVLRYAAISGIEDENAVPEIYMGGFIAGGIHDDLGLHARVEVLYTDLARQLGVTLTEAHRAAFGGHRADVAVYRAGQPVAIIEMKIHDDYARVGLVVSDRDKMQRLAELCDIECHVGIMVTDTISALHSERVRTLSEALGFNLELAGEPQVARKGWGWCIATGRLLSKVR